MNNGKIIYSLNIEDLQTVANQELNRDLTKKEIELIKESLPENINWYEAIANAISDKIRD